VPAQRFGWAAGAAAAAHVFVPGLDDACTVDGDDGRHLQRVRRLRPGEAVTAADGSGAWRPYEIVAAHDGRLDLVAAGEVTLEPDVVPRLTVAVALAKGGLDDVVAGCTELGVHRIEPLRTARTVVRLAGERAAAARRRWQGVAREAAMQSRRARVPEVAEVADVRSLRDRPGLVVADRAGAAPASLEPPPGGEWLVVVGPEGGLAPEELDALVAPRVRVGHHVLRARRAPLAVVAALVERTTPVPDVVN
jgi:16S rRNA (uracil1498-N3)-methyltransferase